MEKQVKPGVGSGKALDPNAKKLEKEKKLKEQKELALLFKPVQSQKIEKGEEMELCKKNRHKEKPKKKTRRFGNFDRPGHIICGRNGNNFVSFPKYQHFHIYD